MAQKRFHNYQDAVESSRFVQHMAVLHSSGRYAGFNIRGTNSGLNMNIRHNATGLSTSRTLIPSASGVESPIGLWVSKQGTVIQEDGFINVTCADNSANAFVRYDLFYGEHDYVSIVGGQAATYGVITGLASRTIPALSNPNIQTPLGIIEIPANAANLDNATFWPVGIGTLGAEYLEIWETVPINTGNGWASMGEQGGPGGPIYDPQIRKDKFGWVHLRGRIDGSAATSNNPLGMPRKYWKSRQYDTETSLIPSLMLLDYARRHIGYGGLTIFRTDIAVAGNRIFDLAYSYYVGFNPLEE
jgi:hypothetical protein